jgi:hypothetical protein
VRVKKSKMESGDKSRDRKRKKRQRERKRKEEMKKERTRKKENMKRKGRWYASQLWRIFGDGFVQSKIVHQCDCELGEDRECCPDCYRMLALQMGPLDVAE